MATTDAPLPDWMRPAAAPAPALNAETRVALKALREIREREGAMTSLKRFAKKFVNVVPALHHEIICDAVDDLVFGDCFDVLVVMSPPASAKSTYISVAAPAYLIGRNPTTRIISVSRAAELAADFGGRVKNIVEDDVFALTTKVSIDSSTRAKDNWKTTAGGGYFAVGASGGVLGKRADVVICDDIHASFEDAQSETQLAKLRSWFEGDLLSRLTPTGKLIVIGQRLNANDIIGFVLKRAADNPRIRLKLLKFSAEAPDPPDPRYPDPLGRQPGERMWPEFYTEDYLHDKKRDAFIWKTLWMQEPPSEDGSWVSTDDIRFRPAPTPDQLRERKCYGMTDLALSVNSGDYTTHFIVAVDHNGDWDIVHGERGRVDVEQSSSTVVQLCATYRPLEWLIDDDNASKVFGTLVGTKARHLSVPVPWRPLPLRGQDKETRAAALRGQFKRGKVYMPPDAPFVRWLTNELLTFPNAMGSGVDDGVDALSLIGRRMLVISPSTMPVAVPRVLPTLADMTLNQLWEDNLPRSTVLRI